MFMFVGGLQMILQCQLLGIFRPSAEFDARGGEIVVEVFMNGVRAR